MSDDAEAEKAKVLELAKERNLRVVVYHENHLKIRDVNFYPSTGTFYRDGRSRQPEKGASAFIAYVESISPSRAPRAVIPLMKIL